MNEEEREELNGIYSSLERLEKRISRIESKLDLHTSKSLKIESKQEIIKHIQKKNQQDFESTLGEKWFSRFGLVLLYVSLFFILSLPFESLPAFLPSAIGIIISLTILLMVFKNKLSVSLQHAKFILVEASFLLFYFSIFRFRFLGATHLIDSNFALGLFLVSASFAIIYRSIKYNSYSILAINLLLPFISAFISESYTLGVIVYVIMAGMALFVYNLDKFRSLYTEILILIYCSFIIQFRMFVSQTSDLNEYASIILYPIFIVLLISVILAQIIRYNKGEKNQIYSVNSFLNPGFAYLIILILSLPIIKNFHPLPHFVSFIIFIAIAIYEKSKENNLSVIFFYAMTSFFALTLAILNTFNFPLSIQLLGFQGLAVILFAIWTRQKYIIVANFIIYWLIYISFLFIREDLSFISINFGIVGLISARMLCWRKEVLDLKTENMRNAYLISALFIIPFSLIYSVNETFLIPILIALSIGYYLLGIALKSTKYRWMGHANLLFTAFYTIAFGASNMEPLHRILAFILISIIFMTVSYFSRKSNTKKTIKHT